MILVCLEQFANGNIHVQGKKNGPKIHNGKGTNNNIMPSGNVKENFYMKQSVIYLLRDWIIEGIPQISAYCVWVVCLEVMGIRPNVHWMAQNWNAAWTEIMLHDENIDSKIFVMLDKWHHFSSQRKSVSIATFKAFYVFYVRKSFAKSMRVTDSENKLTVKEFFKSVNIKHVAENHGWNMGSDFLILK